MQYAPFLDHIPATHASSSVLQVEADVRAAQAADFVVTKRLIGSPLQIGETSYPLRAEMIGSYYPGRDRTTGEGEFVVPQLYPSFIGRGRGVEDAFRDWRDLVHSTLQDLFAKRPFEMTHDEQTTWQLLLRHINIETYRLTAPLTYRQMGRVVQARPKPRLIEWEDGIKERVGLDQMPGEFAGYKPGQRFEATVARDPQNSRLIRVLHIRRIKRVPRLTPEEIRDLSGSVATTRKLPDAGWQDCLDDSDSWASGADDERTMH